MPPGSSLGACMFIRCWSAAIALWMEASSSRLIWKYADRRRCDAVIVTCGSVMSPAVVISLRAHRTFPDHRL